mmetsp:Transcript_58730/g.182437  ORF Transcript_58730/g.182437 Transcript_58730/m.182437 type:complete len:126 (+) Transcript_58730:101-478(+)
MERSPSRRVSRATLGVVLKYDDKNLVGKPPMKTDLGDIMVTLGIVLVGVDRYLLDMQFLGWKGVANNFVSKPPMTAKFRKMVVTVGDRPVGRRPESRGPAPSFGGDGRLGDRPEVRQPDPLGHAA